MVKTFAPLLQNNPQFQLKMHEKGGDKTMLRSPMPQSPQPIYFAMPANGVVFLEPERISSRRPSGGGANGLKPDLKKLVAERKKTRFRLLRHDRQGQATRAASSPAGAGSCLDKRPRGEMSATFANARKGRGTRPKR